MSLCKRCNKREIDTSRSKNLCTLCLESSKLRSRKSSAKTGSSITRKYLGLLALSMNLCKSCFHSPVDFSHSICYCTSCLNTRKKGNTKHRESHRSDAIKNSSEWRKLNPERMKSSIKRWAESNKEKMKVFRKNRKARIRNAEGSFTEQEWTYLLDRYEHRCLWCGKSNVELTADHVIPVSRGGSNYIENIQPLCANCNSKKHTKTIDFRPFGSAILEWT